MQTVTETVSILPYDAVATAFVVILGLFGVIITVDKVADVIKKWFSHKEKPVQDIAAQHEKCAKMFRADDERMRKIETEINILRNEMDKRKEGERVLIAGVRELLEHELHNGNGAAMKDASDDLFNYLNKK